MNNLLIIITRPTKITTNTEMEMLSISLARIFYLTKVSQGFRKENRLNISRKFIVNFDQVLFCKFVFRSEEVAPFSHLNGSIDLLHPVVPDVL